MIKTFTERKRFRKNLGSISDGAKMPDLIELQKSSYDDFLQLGVKPESRQNVGLQGVFSSFFPIRGNGGRFNLEFIKYELDESRFSEEECRRKGLTYFANLRATFRLTCWNTDDNGNRVASSVKDQSVYICELPIMTRYGTFIVNGVERVVVSQMQRSPGVFFDHDNGKTHSSGKYLFAAHIIPARGVWLDFEFDAKDHMCVRIDRKRKVSVVALLMAMLSDESEQMLAKDSNVDRMNITGMDKEEILKSFYHYADIVYSKNGVYSRRFVPEEWHGVVLEHQLINADDGAVVGNVGDKITARVSKKLVGDGLKNIVVHDSCLIGRYCAADIVDLSTGIVLLEAGDEITEENLPSIKALKTNLQILLIDEYKMGSYMRDTIAADRISSREEALFEIYRVLRPGDPPTFDGAESLFKGLFFDQERYDLSIVGRVKMNARLGINDNRREQTLTKDDVLRILVELHRVRDGYSSVDDIDNLGNRRVRCVGELLENQFRVGLSRVERAIHDRMSAVDNDTSPNDVINAKPVTTAIREFFSSSQLSQFMDQTNPLSEVTHKRRISALGPGGLSRDRAGFEVRDVHPTHYGRICPIETPEGPNIGLINSLATFARINSYGFIETPYRKVINCKVTDEVVYLSANEEGQYVIAQANAAVDSNGFLIEDVVSCRVNGEPKIEAKELVTLMDVSPKQLISVAAGLIPFLENDDAGRALMGSNMQRQAVPLMRAQAPLVGTGMEKVVAVDSGASVIAKRDGVIESVDANRIVVRAQKNGATIGVDIYNLRKFERSNQSTCINQKAVVRAGDVIKKNDVIADGSGTDLGELALGHNVLVGFMTWNGYNYEDAIIISERLVKEDKFTSIHIEEFEVMARDTKLGCEEITRDLPNVSEESVRNLDESGIINIGAEVKAGDILVGKVTPKGETPMTPEEKLLRAIFGERAADVRDSSLRLPPGCVGTVVDVKVFSRRGVEKDERANLIERKAIDDLKKDYDIQKNIIENNFIERLKAFLVGKQYKSFLGKRGSGEISKEMLDGLSIAQLGQIGLVEDDDVSFLTALKAENKTTLDNSYHKLESDVEKVKAGDELLPGVLKTVKVYVADKRKLQAGDKLAGRHGNKGVVAKIVPVEDMPHFEDGTPLDIILNPLGVPSRMNLGQILETHLGWASMGLGQRVKNILSGVAENNVVKELRAELNNIFDSDVDKAQLKKMSDYEVVDMATHLIDGVPVANPVFDGISEKKISELLRNCGFDSSGQVTLIDGRTGDAFDRKITVGCIYMLKLHHMVDDKLHARSIGTYSLVTQQPLGGKAQFGGQRFGEMEVWALQAYGAANVLQEVLTIKSDDVTGRTKAYESIVRGDNNISPGIPESFNVLSKEICSLGLNFEFQHIDCDSIEDEECQI